MSVETEGAVFLIRSGEYNTLRKLQCSLFRIVRVEASSQLIRSV